MRSYLPFVVIGLTSGAVYAIAALGLVLTYRTSGVFNFAHGAIGMVSAYAYYSLHQHVPTAVAMLVALLVVAPIIGIVADVIFRRVQGAGPAAAVVASLGILVALQGLVVVIYGADLRRVPAFLPTGSYRIADVNVGIDQTVIVAIAVAATLGLGLFMKRTHLGLETRAVVDNRSLAGLSGSRPARVTRWAWMIGCAFAATSGILLAPIAGLDSLLLTLLVVDAFGAAAVGRFRSFALTAAGAFGLGVAQSIAAKIVGETGSESLTGLPRSLPFFLLFGALMLSRRGGLREVAVATRATVRRGGTARFRFRPVSLLAVVGVAVVLPGFLTGSQRLTLTATVAYVLVFASLSLLVGLSRQLSLAHGVFVALGATTLAHLRSAGVPFLLALLLAGLLLTPLGAVLAIPAVRLSSLYLGLATFAFGILAQTLLFRTGIMFGVSGDVFIRRPAVLAGDVAFYYFVLAVVVAGVVAVEVIRVTRLGRVLVALADSPTAVGSLGVNSVVTRVVVFCLSAFLAGLAGGLLGTMVQAVNTASFTAFQSLVWVTVLVTAGTQTFGGVVLSAVLLVAVPGVFSSATVSEWQPVIFGAAAIVLAQADNGLIGLLRTVDFAALAERNEWRRESRRTGTRRRTSGVDPAPASAVSV